MKVWLAVAKKLGAPSAAGYYIVVTILFVGLIWGGNALSLALSPWGLGIGIFFYAFWPWILTRASEGRFWRVPEVADKNWLIGGVGSKSSSQ